MEEGTEAVGVLLSALSVLLPVPKMTLFSISSIFICLPFKGTLFSPFAGVAIAVLPGGQPQLPLGWCPASEPEGHQGSPQGASLAPSLSLAGGVGPRGDRGATRPPFGVPEPGATPAPTPAKSALAGVIPPRSQRYW